MEGNKIAPVKDDVGNYLSDRMKEINDKLDWIKMQNDAILEFMQVMLHEQGLEPYQIEHLRRKIERDVQKRYELDQEEKEITDNIMNHIPYID